MTVRAAVVGCGDVSSVHFAALDRMDDVALVGVCDVDDARREAAASTHAVPGFAGLADLLGEVHPDVVHIATPHHTHAELAIAALDAGVNVLLEKPLAHSCSAGADLVAAAQRAAARPGAAQLGVCLQNRYNAPVQVAHALLASGELGVVLGGHASVFWHRDAAYYENRPWRGRWATGGGGLLMNQAIHTVDLLQWLLGEVTEVRGSVATRVLGDVIDVEDTADAVFTHAGGVVSTFYATLANAVNAPVCIEIATEAARLTISDSLVVHYADGRVAVTPERPRHRDGRAYWGVSHEVLIRDFYDAVAARRPFWIDAREAARSLDVIQRIYDETFGAVRP